MKPSVSDKVMTRDRINLLEIKDSVKAELETAEVPSKFFSNIANNLEISKYSKHEPFLDNTEDKTLTLAYKNLPSIFVVQNNFKGRDAFYLRELEKEEIQKEIHTLNTNKVSHYFDIPTKFIRSSSNIFGDFLYVSINSSMKFSLFLSSWISFELES